MAFRDKHNAADEEDSKETTLERRPDWTKLLGQPHNRDVRVWIDVQRYQYARLQRDEASSLTPDRIEKIERRREARGRCKKRFVRGSN